MILVDGAGLTMRRPDKPLFVDFSITIQDTDRIGVVGINGCGKSTLLRVLAGMTDPEAGVVRRGRGVRVEMLGQHPSVPDGTVAAAVPGWEGAAILDRLGMGALAEADVRTLSGGQAKRVALAQALVSEAELLVLDEPTNHLDLDAITWLEERLARRRGGLLLVTHDRHVLDRVCTKVIEIDRGSAYVHEGGYQGYLDGRALREDQAAQAESVRANLARRELAWLLRGAPARTRKPKAHIDAARALIERRPQAAARAANIGFGAATGRSGEGQGPSASSLQGSFRHSLDERLAPRLGNKVIELHGVGHRFPPAEWLFRDLDWILDPGGRYGIVGANGSGKTTLLEILARRLTPAEGSVQIGPTVRLGVYDQFGKALDLSLRVRDAVSRSSGAPGSPEDLRLMEAFWFDSDAQWAEIGTLSGGERRRLQLLLTLIERPNVLLLDEPTNDLDLDTLRALEDFLEDWPGTVVVVSHDRAFMDRTVEDVLAIENGTAGLVLDGYAGWRAARDERLSQTGPGANRRTPVLGDRSGLITAGSAGPAGPAGPAGDGRPGEGSGEGTSRRSGGQSDPVDGAALSAPRSPSTLRHLLKECEKEVARFTRAKGSAEDELTAASAAGDHRALAEIGARVAVLSESLAAAEERWLDLAEEAEAARRLPI